MSKPILLCNIGILLCLIVCAVITISDNPKVTSGKIITIDSIVIHDTIIKHSEGIKLNTVIQKVIVYDTVLNTTVKTSDSTKCFTMEETMEDGAYIKAEICSDSFVNVPLDLSGTITYLPATDTQVTELRIDTVQVQKPFYNSWIFYSSVLAAFVLGVGLVAK